MRRVVLKLSGEAFSSASPDETIDAQIVDRLAIEITAAREKHGVQIAVVVGGGNIWRGATGVAEGMDRAQADYMGMLATVINAMALQDALERCDQPSRVMTAIHMAQVAEPYIRGRAIRHLEKGRIVILAAGIGSPFFTTDTAAALRAVELEADVLLKGTHGGVDGIYDADPRKHAHAKKIDRTSHAEVIIKELRVMDLTAMTLSKDNNLPICVFDIMTPGNIEKILSGEQIGTRVE